MTATIERVLAAVDRAAIQRELDALRTQLKNYDDLLALLDRIEAQTEPQNPVPAPVVSNGNGSHTATSNGKEHKPRAEKRGLILAIMRGRPGRWTTQEMRAALDARGVDAEAGTPVKNVLWELAKAGEVHSSGGGVYEFPPLTVSVEPPAQEVLAA